MYLHLQYAGFTELKYVYNQLCYQPLQFDFDLDCQVYHLPLYWYNSLKGGIQSYNLVINPPSPHRPTGNVQTSHFNLDYTYTLFYTSQELKATLQTRQECSLDSLCHTLFLSLCQYNYKYTPAFFCTSSFIHDKFFWLN